MKFGPLALALIVTAFPAVSMAQDAGLATDEAGAGDSGLLARGLVAVGGRLHRRGRHLRHRLLLQRQTHHGACHLGLGGDAAGPVGGQHGERAVFGPRGAGDRGGQKEHDDVDGAHR